MKTTLLSVKCNGLEMHSKSPLLSQGFFASLTGPAVARNVKKFVRVQKSEAFPLGGRPPSLLYDTVYESEMFDDAPSVGPSLIAEITNAMDKDCKIRVNVYYSSSLTNSKEVLFAGTSFNLRDVTRCTKPFFSSAMVSEHCQEAVTEVRIVPTLDPILHTASLSSKNLPYEPWNPMFQRYIFHPNITHSTPVVCEEYTWEPRLAFQVPLVFLQNFADVMTETIEAWKVRAKLERVRQGRFISRDEAFLNGWFEVSVSVSAARITAMSSERRPSDDIGVSTSVDGPSVDLRHLSVEGRGRVDTAGSEGGRVGKKSLRSALIPRMPATYVQVTLEHRSLQFSAPVGRTNTEHNSLFPSYGSNANANKQQKGPIGQASGDFQLSPLADPENVRITKIPHEFRIDALTMSSSADGGYVVETDHGADQASLKTRRGSKSVFHVFTPFGGGAEGRVRLDLMLDDPSGGTGTLVGECYVDLRDIVPCDSEAPSSIQEAWVPVSIRNTIADPKWTVLNAEILVGVSIQRQEPSAQTKSRDDDGTAGSSRPLVPVSPRMPQVRCYDPEKDSIAHNSILRSLSGGEEKVEPQSAVPPKMKMVRRPTFANFAPDRLSDSDDESSEDEDSAEEDSTPPLSTQLRSASSEPVPTKRVSSQQAARESRSISDGSVFRQASASDLGEPVDMRLAAKSYDRILAECYEWMWHIGFKGVDPLSVSVEEELSSEENVCKRNRADVQYSSTWLNQHVSTLEELLCHIKCLIAFYAEETSREGKRFRASKLKKEIEYQALPVNLHFQLMSLQKCDDGPSSLPGQRGSGVGSSETMVRVVDSITCGAMSPHGLGFKNGGLSNIEQNLQRSKASLDGLKSQYIGTIRQLDNLGSPCFSNHGKEASIRDSLRQAVISYETATADITIRRMYAISQALSICVNSFLYKLELVVEGHIPTFFLDRWLTHGYLIMFECLLSVHGKERGMIEDSRTAVELLNMYRIRLLPSPQSESQEDPATANRWLANEIEKSSKRGGYSYRWWERLDSTVASVHMTGRDVLLFLPDDIINRLSGSVSAQLYSTGCEVTLRPVMFSQGIDIMQSITNTWDSSDAGLSSRDLQLQINVGGLRKLNAYCELVQPINTRGGSSQASAGASSYDPAAGRHNEGKSANAYSGLIDDAHPLTGVLEQLIQSGDPTEKNVEMLLEIERICRMLGGCRVTFCKSGKDRTGMAITLEQSRLLGENFDCGQCVERIMRDASTMRQYGTRLMVAEKNIGKAVYAINRLQIKFLPLFYRPPVEVAEELIKKTDNS